ncbi:MAG: zinc metallopeptidase [Anaerolineae bacterium]|nr:zinc metallopeptidase [Anaerolineae bacterium]
MFFDSSYLLYVFLPTLIITGLAQMWVRNAYNKWSQIGNSSRVNGMDTARALMSRGGIQPVSLEVVQGQMSDHFDPRSETVRLSPGVAQQPSVAAMAIAAHEFGHVQQHQENSPLMAMRTLLVPAATIGPQIGLVLILLGLFVSALSGLAVIGLILFAGTTVFTFVTLPVELDASRRAMKLLDATGLIQSEQDRQGAHAVLRAAAFTYVAAVATSLLTLLYYASLVFGGRRD